MNPKIYCQKTGTEPMFFVGKATEIAPMFDIYLLNCCSDPDYGVQLRESVARHIRGKPPEHRKNTNRIQFRCTDEMKERIVNAMDICSCATIQELMTTAMKIFLMQIEKTAALCTRESSGEQNENFNNNIALTGWNVK